MAAISLRDVTKRFEDGTEAVKDLDLDIPDGEFIILVGPSGSGKSTVLRMIAGLEDISEGELRIGDRVVNDLAPKDRNIAMVFQNYALYPHMTVRENIAFPLTLAKVDKAEIRRKVEEAARILDIDELLDRKPAQLSGGQRQRVAMGRAIVRDPAAFLMDEPLSNLDAKLRVATRTEISRLQQRLGTTTVYVTHDQVEAVTLGDRVVVMRKGVVQQVDTPRELYEHPVNLFVAGFIGSPAMNFVPVTVEGDVLRLPFVDVPLTDELRAAVNRGEGRRLLAGIRPEHFQDVALVSGDVRPAGVTFTAPVDLVESLGSELYVHLRVAQSPGDVPGMHHVAEALEAVELPAAGDTAELIARLDPASRAARGHDLELWLDARRLHLFDADSGANFALAVPAGGRGATAVAGPAATTKQQPTASV